MSDLKNSWNLVLSQVNTSPLCIHIWRVFVNLVNPSIWKDNVKFCIKPSSATHMSILLLFSLNTEHSKMYCTVYQFDITLIDMMWPYIYTPMYSNLWSPSSHSAGLLRCWWNPVLSQSSCSDPSPCSLLLTAAYHV